MNWYNIIKFAQSMMEVSSLKDQIYQMYVENPMSMNAISRQLNIPPHWVAKILREMGVDIAPKEWVAGRYPKIRGQEMGDKVLKDFWLLLDQAKKSARPPKLKSILYTLCQKYNVKTLVTMANFLKAHIPDFEKLVEPFDFSTKFGPTIERSIVEAWRWGYGPTAIARQLGTYDSFITHMLKRLGLFHREIQGINLRDNGDRNLRGLGPKIKVPPLSEILPTLTGGEKVRQRKMANSFFNLRIK